MILAINESEAQKQVLWPDGNSEMGQDLWAVACLFIWPFTSADLGRLGCALPLNRHDLRNALTGLHLIDDIVRVFFNPILSRQLVTYDLSDFDKYKDSP
jgi:hypothetical protein